MPQRSHTADLLKGIAVILMILVHIVELFATPEIFESQFGKMVLFLGGPLCAPIFMVVFGYYLASSQKTILTLLWRGVQLFLAGMLLNFALNGNLFWHVYTGKMKVDILPYAFGVDILQLAGIALIGIAFLRKLLNKSLIITLVVSFLSAYIGQALVEAWSPPTYENTQYIIAYFLGIAHWSYFPLFPWLAYPLLGYAFFQFNQKFDIKKILKPSVTIILGVLYLAFLALSLNYAIELTANLQQYYHHGILFFLWTLVFLTMYSLTWHEFVQLFPDNFLIRFILWLGENVTFIYVVQWIIIGNTATLFYRKIDSISLLIISFLGVLLFSSFLAFGKQKLKSTTP